MKSIASVLSIIALGFGLFGCAAKEEVPFVDTKAAPYGVAGNAYSADLGTTCGITALPWTVSSGALPARLSLDGSTGNITGTPDLEGNSTVVFAVTDSTGKTENCSVLFVVHPRTDRVSVDGNGTAGNGASTEPAISRADGRFIVFTSLATLVPTPGGSGAQIFMHDRQTGQPNLISINNVGNAGNGASSQPSISSDGRYVAFTSAATLVPTPGGSGTQIFLRDTQTNTTTLVSRDAGGTAGNGASSQPSISADGRYVAFTSGASNLAPIPGASGLQIFLRDTVTNTTTLVSQDAVTVGNAGNGASSAASITSNGGFVAFSSAADFSLGATLPFDVYVRAARVLP